MAISNEILNALSREFVTLNFKIVIRKYSRQIYLQVDGFF